MFALKRLYSLALSPQMSVDESVRAVVSQNVGNVKRHITATDNVVFAKTVIREGHVEEVVLETVMIEDDDLTSLMRSSPDCVGSACQIGWSWLCLKISLV